MIAMNDKIYNVLMVDTEDHLNLWIINMLTYLNASSSSPRLFAVTEDSLMT